MDTISYRAILHDALALPKDKEMQATDVYHRNEGLIWPKKSNKFLPTAFPKLNALVALSGVRVIHEQGKTPVTSGLGDSAYIQMPMPEDFVSPAAYGHVLLHELAHYTHHCGILMRPWDYSSSQEELVAELSSYMLSDMFGITGMDQMALSYLKAFVEMLASNFEVVFGIRTREELFEESFNAARAVVKWAHGLVGEPEPV